MSENKLKPAQLSLLDKPEKKPTRPPGHTWPFGTPVQVIGSGTIIPIEEEYYPMFSGVTLNPLDFNIGPVEIRDDNYEPRIIISNFSSLTNEDVAVIARAVKNAATLTDSKNIADFLSYWTNTTPEVAATIAEKLESTINEEK